MKKIKILLNDRIHWNSPETFPEETNQSIIYVYEIRPPFWSESIVSKRKNPTRQVIGTLYRSTKLDQDARSRVLGWCVLTKEVRDIVTEFQNESNSYRNGKCKFPMGIDNRNDYSTITKEDELRFNTRTYTHDTRVRVPSLKRSDAEWRKFYKTFPYVYYLMKAGQTHINGAKLKNITVN